MLHFAFLRSRNRKLENLFGVEFGLCLPPICLLYIMRQGLMHPRLAFYIVEDSLEFLVLCLPLKHWDFRYLFVPCPASLPTWTYGDYWKVSMVSKPIDENT